MKLKRVLGFTTSGRNSFVCNPNNGNLIYIAGCVIVILDPQTKVQDHLFTDSKLPITTLTISEDGSLLASANCGDRAQVHIWDLTSKTLVAELVSYNVEVSCLSFAPDARILVSAGYDQDEKSISIWDWKRKLRISSHKVTTKIRAISFSYDGTYFVAVGDSYVKYWYIQETNAEKSSSSIVISGSRTASLGEQKKNNFCDVKCGRGIVSSSTFCITKTGLLCELDNRRLLLHKWVDLKTTCANSLAIGENLIVIGCSNGIIRCFNTTEFRFLKNIPRPHALGIDIGNARIMNKMNNSNSITNSKDKAIYPNVVSVNLTELSNTISCVYNDRSIYVWDLNDSTQIMKKYSALYHNSCIWGIDMYPYLRPSSLSDSSCLPNGSFVTCSSDDTLRIWNPNVFSSKLNSNRKDERIACTNENSTGIYRGSLYTDESLKIIFTDATYKFLCELDSYSDKTKANENYDSNEGLRCLKISPDGSQLAVGSRSGAIRIFDFGSDKEIKNIAAHDAEVLCLEYSDPKKYNGFCYLASSSRDKLIHIFDAANDYNFLQTIDDHLSSITALRFVNNRARDCLQLISCGADCRIIFRNGVEINGSGQLSFLPDQHIEGKNTFYDMEVDSESSCLITACQDRMIRLFNVAQVKYQSGFKGSLTDEGTLIKIALDSSCTFLATSSTDKSINLYDYQRGEKIGSIVKGLSDLVTDLRFSPDSRYLITCTGDGCIFIWKSPAEVVNAVRGEMGQLSLSSCSLDSFNGAKVFSETHENNEQKSSKPYNSTTRRQSLPDWAKQRSPPDAPEKSLSHGKLKAETITPYSTNRKLSSNEAFYDELNVNHYQGRYQVQNASALVITSNNNDNEHEYAKVKSPRSAHNSYSNTEDTSNLSSPASTRSRITCSRVTGSDSTRLSTSNGLAKLYQSRENLEKISSREKFLADNFAHNNQEVGKNVVKINSSLSGLFNTKQYNNSEIDSHATYTTIGGGEDDDEDSVSNGIYAELQGGKGAEMPYQGDEQKQSDILLSGASSRSQLFQRQSGDVGAIGNSNLSANVTSRQQPAHFYSTNQTTGFGDKRLSRSMNMLNAELGCRSDQLNSYGDELPSAKDESLLSSSKNHQSSDGKEQKTSSRQKRQSNEQSSNLMTVGAEGRIVVKGSGSGATAGARAKIMSRKLSQQADVRDIVSLRSYKSECNIQAVDIQEQQMVVDSSAEGEELLYCQKVDLTKVSPNSPHISKEFCQYIVEELHAISKYAIKLHQALQLGKNHSLCSILSDGVHSSLDVLSIIPPQSMNRQKYHQSYVNLGPASIASHHNLGEEVINHRQVPTSPTSFTRPQFDQQASSSTLKREQSNYLSQGGSNTLSDFTRRKEKLVNNGKLEGSQVKLAETTSKISNPLNLDQVLEDYSNRLFKMVQNRMVEQHNLPDIQAKSTVLEGLAVNQTKTSDT